MAADRARWADGKLATPCRRRTGLTPEAYRLFFAASGFGNEFANPVAAPSFDVPRHRFRRGWGRVRNVFANLSTIQPSAAMRIAGFGDQADRLTLLQHHITIGRKEGAG